MIPFSPPHIDKKITDAVTDALKSGWITTGPKTKEFEKELEKYCKNKRTIAVNSATAGLELVLRWFGVKEGDEVILPVYTYCATANVVEHCGATPIMVDINPDDFNINIDNIRNAITDRTKVIIPVDFAGLPCSYNDINSVVREKEIQKLFNPNTEIQEKLGRILVLSDAAHSVGAEYLGEKTGSLTDISVFSFHAVKNLTTAEGGAIAFNLPSEFEHDELYKYFNMISLHGQTKDAFSKTAGGNWKYDVVDAGYKANMTDVLASIGLVELFRYNKVLKRRREIFDLYTKGFKECNWAQLPTYIDKDRISSCHIYPLRIKEITEETRDIIIDKIYEQGVSVNVHFQPLPMLSYYKKKGYNINDYPTAYDSYAREISLPVYYDLTNSDIEKVIVSVKESINEIYNKII